MTSPTEDRLATISSRLSQIQFSFDQTRHSRVEELEKQCKNLEMHAWEAQNEIDKQLSGLRSDLHKLRQMHKDSIASSESYFAHKATELENLEDSLREILQSADSYANNSKMQNVLQDRIDSLTHELSREKALARESSDSVLDFFNSKIKNVHTMLTAEKTEIKRIHTEWSSTISSTAHSVQEKLKIDHKEREESENGLVNMIKEVGGKFKKEIENERKERESSEETLLGLLEETCNKLKTVTNN